MALSNQAKSARDAYSQAQNTRRASKAATTMLHGNIKSMTTTAADMVKSIKSFASNAADPGTVYAAAQIPAPAAPTPPPPPGLPTDINVGLNPDGSLTLRWRAVDAAPSSGAFFSVMRPLASSGTLREHRRRQRRPARDQFVR